MTSNKNSTPSKEQQNLRENLKPKETDLEFISEHKISKLFPKPDFSPIIEKSMKYEFKVPGSYKKQKEEVPASPTKTPNNKFFTPIKIEGKNLFGAQPAFRKLSFENIQVDNHSKNYPTKSLFDTLSKSKNCEAANVEQDEKAKKIKSGKLDSEFCMVKLLHENKFRNISIVRSNSNSQIFCIKRVFKNSAKCSFKTTNNLFSYFFNQFDGNKLSKFCVKYEDFWIEEEILDIIENISHFTDKNLFILYDYYTNGDLLDFLENLEKAKFAFSNDFYWDLIFEMMCGVLFVNQCDFVHLDVKPANFLVDAQGYIALNDYGLSQKLNQFNKSDDIFEGDSKYISPEVFYRKPNTPLNIKSDTFSLGLSILEILAKIELPKNGPLWQQIRNENFELPKEFLCNWNIKDNKEFISLVNDMILPIQSRPDLSDLLLKYRPLKTRFDNLNEGAYKKSVKIPGMKGKNRKNSLRSKPSTDDINL